MLFNNPMGNGKSKSRAAQLTAAGFIRPVKALENLGLIIIADTDPRIFHSQDSIRVGCVECDLNTSACECVFDRVIEEDVTGGSQPFGLLQ